MKPYFASFQDTYFARFAYFAQFACFASALLFGSSWAWALGSDTIDCVLESKNLNRFDFPEKSSLKVKKGNDSSLVIHGFKMEVKFGAFVTGSTRSQIEVPTDITTDPFEVAAQTPEFAPESAPEFASAFTSALAPESAPAFAPEFAPEFGAEFGAEPELKPEPKLTEDPLEVTLKLYTTNGEIQTSSSYDVDQFSISITLTVDGVEAVGKCFL